jgi:hypothetical protein
LLILTLFGLEINKFKCLMHFIHPAFFAEIVPAAVDYYFHPWSGGTQVMYAKVRNQMLPPITAKFFSALSKIKGIFTAAQQVHTLSSTPHSS